MVRYIEILEMLFLIGVGKKSNNDFISTEEREYGSL